MQRCCAAADEQVYLEPLTKPSEAVLARRVAADSAEGTARRRNNARRVFERL
jgi:hypothetical protein